MSCLNPNYNPRPTREWGRFENPCAYEAQGFTSSIGDYEIAILKKGNVLQYKKNSANINKNQRYAQIARGAWTNRTTTWATQSQTYTNPNMTSLRRVGYTGINAETLAPTTDPITCNVPILPTNNSLPINNGGGESPSSPPIIPPPTPGSGSNTVLPPIIPITPAAPIIIPDGGTLICNVSENICTGEIYGETKSQFCYPTTDSDVPGPIMLLCYNDGLPTYYPRTRRTYPTSGNKWPQGAKLLFSANSIVPVNNRNLLS